MTSARFYNLQFHDLSTADFHFELLPLRSPLLRQSLLVSFPPLTDMLKFGGCSCLISGADWRKLISEFLMLSLTQRNHFCKWPLRWKLNFTHSYLTRKTNLNRIEIWEINLTHWNKHADRISRQRSLRSKIWWLAEFCNSHCVSHFAAFFIVMGTKISIVENFLIFWFLSSSFSFTFKFSVGTRMHQ